MAMDREEIIKVLQKEIIDWQEARASYENTGDEEIKEEGHQSLETIADTERATKKIEALSQAIALLSQSQVGMSEEISRLREALNTDRTGLAETLNKVKAELKGRQWIVEGRGSYKYDDEEYRKETGYMIQAALKIIDDGLRKSGNLATKTLSSQLPKKMERERLIEIIKQKDIEFRTINDESEEFKPPISLSREYLEYIADAILKEV